MIVADSSYIVHGLINDESMLQNRPIVTPDLALYEIINAIWKHEVVLKDIKSSRRYLDFMFELVSSNALQFIRPDRKIVEEAYMLAVVKKCAFYDAIFIVLAKELKADLQTVDETQRRVFKSLQ